MNTDTWSTYLKHSVFLLGCLLVCTLSYPRISLTKSIRQNDPTQVRELLYLPNAQGVKFLSFGYRNFLADVIWFSTINYFGKHYYGDRDFRWLFHMCDLITSLNPEALYVYEFGSTMLSWEQNAPDKAVELLTKAIEHHPDNWKLYYLRGFTTMFFLKDETHAVADFVSASKLPGADPLVARLATKKMAQLEDPRITTQFLDDLLKTNSDPAFRNAIEQRLKATKRLVRNQQIAFLKMILGGFDASLPNSLRFLPSPP